MNRGNLILAALALILGALLMLDGDELPGAPEPTSLTRIDPEQVDHIQLFLGDAARPVIDLQRGDNRWRLTQPVQIEADPFAIGQVLSLLGARSSESLDPESLDLARLKLDPPLWRVRFDDVEMRIGGIESLRQQRYVMHDDRIHLVPDFNPAPFDGNYADLASRRLLPSTASIQQIRWPDAEPVAAADMPAGLIERWQQAEAQWTSRPLPTDFDSVDARVTVITDTQSLDFLICARQPRLKLIRPDIDVLYNLPGSAADELLKPDA